MAGSPTSPLTNGTAPDAVETIRHIKYLEEKYNKGNRVLTVKGERTSTADINEARDPNRICTSTQVFDEKDKPTKKKLWINSAPICDVLQDVLQTHPDKPSFENEIELESPFEMLFHYEEEIRHKQTQASAEDRFHFDLLLNYLEEQPGADAAKFVDKDLITFELLWAIFKPGEYVCKEEDGHWEILWLQRTARERDSQAEMDYLKLECFVTASDGTTVGKAFQAHRIYESEFPGLGPRTISELSIFPLNFYKSTETGLKEVTSDRSKRYLEFEEKKKPTLQHYKGLCKVFVPYPRYKQPEWEPQTIAGRVIVDTKAFMEEYPSKRIRVLPWPDSKESKSLESRLNKSTKSMPEDTKILCPSYTYGYSLGMRKWCKLFVHGLSEVEWEKSMWDSHLILSDSQRTLLDSMVSSHLFPSGASMHDEDSLKGKGLVVALRGPPGTGKTLTAVAIAEKHKKPLLLYPAGELGSELYSIESSVKTIVRHASTWKAVLLIDEADVFLESRETGAQADLKRNALVAVFLRQLEYSQAIIFLTSNRAQMFDAAVKSRLHLSLYYPRPGRETRRTLWKYQLSKIEPDKKDLDEAKAARFASKYAMDGREITNVRNAVMKYAGSSGNGKLRHDHLEDVLRVWETSNPSRAREIGESIKHGVNRAIPILGLFVLLGLAVIILVHGYKMARDGRGDILIIYR